MSTIPPNLYQVRHSVSGRLRVSVPSIRSDPRWAAALESALAHQPHLIHAIVRPVTCSVILKYDPKAVPVRAVLDALDRGLESAARHQVSVGPMGPDSLTGGVVELPHPSVGSLRRRVVEIIALTGFVAYSALRGLAAGAPLAQGPFSLVAGVAALGAVPALVQAWRDVRQGRVLSLFPFLVGTAVLAAVAGEAFTALEIIWILRVGMLLDDYVADRSRRAIREMLESRSGRAYVLVNGVEVALPLEKLRVGDEVVVHAEEKIPVDGSVVRGEAMIDESLLTGRAEPQHRVAGDRLFAGTLSTQGAIVVIAERVGRETYVSRIVSAVEVSLRERAPAERRADLLAARLARLGGLAAAATLLLTGSFVRTLTVLLVMSCPCATVLAASTATTAALATAARRGALVKGGRYLEEIGEVDCFCFDKTGTLTVEIPRVVEVIPRAPWMKPQQLLLMAASVEGHGQHPMARALRQAAEMEGLALAGDLAPEFFLGRGVRSVRGDETVLVGNARFMEEQGVDIAYFRARASRLADRGNSLLYVARNQKLQGMIVLTGDLRPNAKEVAGCLRGDKVSELHLVSGDLEASTRAAAEALGAEGYRAELLPEEKADYVDQLKSEGRRVALVGDGVNDTLAMSRAHVGVAIGTGGAEAATEAADIALVDADLSRLVALRRLSHDTLTVIDQNHWMATGTNIVGVLLATSGRLTPVMGGLFHVVHTTIILANSSRLLGWNGDDNSCATLLPTNAPPRAF